MPYSCYVMRARRQPRQLSLPDRRHGGRRPGAGRPKTGTAGVSHAARPRLASRFPVHVTLRALPHVYSLRAGRCFRPIRRAFRAARERLGVRLVEFSVQGNHIHLVCEAADAQALARALQGLQIRVAKALNRVMGTRGRVFADRYHAHILRTPTEVRRALAYVVGNLSVHAVRRGSASSSGADPRSSAAPGHDATAAPHTWLLRSPGGPVRTVEVVESPGQCARSPATSASR